MLTTLALSNGQLSQSQQDQYWRDGYLFPLPALDADIARQTRIEFERMEQDWLSRDLPHPMNTYKRVNAHVVMPMAARIA